MATAKVDLLLQPLNEHVVVAQEQVEELREQLAAAKLEHSSLTCFKIKLASSHGGQLAGWYLNVHNSFANDNRNGEGLDLHPCPQAKLKQCFDYFKCI